MTHAHWLHGTEMTHDDLVRWTVDYFNRRPDAYAYATHNNQYPPLEAGIADVAIHGGGRTTYYEVKLPGDRIGPAQHAFALRCQRAGVKIRIVSSIDDVMTGGKPWPIETGKLKKAERGPGTTAPGTTRPGRAGTRRRSPRR